MVVLNKKRISIMLLIILVGIFTFSYHTADKGMEGELQSQNQEQNKYVTTTPVSNKVVVLDAGHGVPDEGD